MFSKTVKINRLAISREIDVANDPDPQARNWYTAHVVTASQRPRAKVGR